MSKLQSMPTFLACTRQALPNLPNSSIENTRKGAYAVIECADPDIVLIGTGSEVGVCVDAAKEMSGKKVRVVSMPCWELFREQSASYKEDLLPKNIPKMSVEAAVTMGWQEWADAMVGVNVFGASAPGGTCLDKFGFNAKRRVVCRKVLGGRERCLVRWFAGQTLMDFCILRKVLRWTAAPWHAFEEASTLVECALDAS